MAFSGVCLGIHGIDKTSQECASTLALVGGYFTALSIAGQLEGLSLYDTCFPMFLKYKYWDQSKEFGQSLKVMNDIICLHKTSRTQRPVLLPHHPLDLYQ